MPIRTSPIGLEPALEWYERLLGRPADARPIPILADWHFPDTGDLQLVQDADRAGGGLVTLTVDDLRAHVAGIASPIPTATPSPWSSRDARTPDPSGQAVS